MTRVKKQLGICAVITGSTPETFKRNIRKALSQKADSLELRLDYLFPHLTDRLLTELIALCKHQSIIVTLRNKKRGGVSRLSNKEEIIWLQKAIDLGVQYVDIDVSLPTKLTQTFHKKSSGIILSHHNFKKTPSAREQLKIAQRMIRHGADVCKIATFARTPYDYLETFAFTESMRKQKIPCIGIAMGKYGFLTRILALHLGCFLTYASASSHHPAAPGMLTIKQLRSFNNFVI